MNRLFAMSILALCLPRAAQGADVVRRAIVVGANDGGSYLDPLLYAERDAERMSDVLIDLAGFEPYNVEYLATPSPAELDDAFAAASAASYDGSETLFLFYYSGHADEQGLHIAGEVYPWDRLKSAVREVPAEVHLGVLDACRSGTVTRIKGARVSEPFLSTNRLDAEGEAWISSAAENEDAQESDQLRGSFFTYYLVSGLRGAADDGTDGFVSLNEAYTYAYDRTVAHTSGTGAGTQHPRYAFDIQGNGDLRLTSVSEASAAIAFPEGITGEVVVMSLPEDTPVGELSLDGEREVVLAVRPGEYRVRRRHDGDLSEMVLTVGSEGRVSAQDWNDGVAMLTLSKGVAEAQPSSARPFPVQIRTRQLSLSWFKQNKGIAGVMSAIVPGTGQMYAGRWVSGGLFLSGALVTNGVGWGAALTDTSDIASGAITGPNFGTLAGLMLYSVNIADAVYRTGSQKPFGPRSGVALSLGSAWSARADRPIASGLSIDVHPTPEFSIGVDRLSFLQTQDEGVFALRAAVRLSAGPQLKRFHPMGFVSVGGEYTIDLDQGTDTVGTGLVGTGARMRFMATPNFFLSADLRAEWVVAQQDVRTLVGADFGFLIGRRQSQFEPIEPSDSVKPDTVDR